MTSPTSRMLTMLSLLQARRDWPGSLLAERLEVTPRTVRRDVDRLRRLGYRIDAIKGPDGGYRLAAGTDLPPLLFDEEQAVALAIALQTVAASGADVDEAARRALATVRQVMPSRLRHRIDGIRFEAAQVAGGMSPGARVHPVVLTAVSDAVRETQVLRFDYTAEGADPDVDEPPRRTEPHGLVARDGRWYLVAWDLDRDDWRLFRLDRLAPRTPSGPRFAPRPIPTGDARSFAAARLTGATEDGRWPCVGEVVIQLPVRRLVPWLADAEVEELDAGSSRIRAGSWSWMGLLASLARLDAPFEVVGPPALVEAAAVLAARLGAARRAPGPV